MKLYIVLILAAICGSVMCGKAEWEADAAQCAKDNNVKVEDVKEAMHGKIPDADVTSDMKCFSLCMAEKCKIIKDGVFQPQALAEKMANNKDLLAKITSECNLKGTDDCDTAHKVLSCIAKNKMHKM